MAAPRRFGTSLVLDSLLKIPANFMVCTEWTPLPADKARKEVNKRRRHFNMSKTGFVSQLGNDATKTNPRDVLVDESKQADIENLGDCLRALGDGQSLGDFSLSIVLYGDSKAEVDNQVGEFVSVFTNADGNLFTETYNQLNAYFATVPGNYALNLRKLYLLNSNYADLSFLFTILPGETRIAHLGTEYLAVLETDNSTPYFLNLHNGEVAHTLILGMTGSGKSYFCNFILQNAQKYAPQTYIFDIGGSFQSLTTIFGGSYLNVGQDALDFTINPFSLAPTKENLQFLFSFFRVLIEGNEQRYRLDFKEEHKLWDAIERIYVLEPEQRTVSSFSNIIGELKERLHRWTQGGQYGFLFDNPKDTLSFSRFQTFNFAGWGDAPEVLEPLLFYVLHRASNEIADPKKLATFKMFLMDEAWLFIKNETIRSYIVSAQKTWRKHNAAMILATQSIKELEESGMLQIVSESCPTKIFLANPEMDRALYREAFHLNDTELELIAGLVPPGQMLIRKAQSSKKVQLNVDSVTHWTATNNERATPGQEHVPPVMIVVCDNTDIAELVYQKISGETQVELVTQADIEADEEEEEVPAKGKKKSKVKWITSYGPSTIRPELANTEDRKHTIRIDTKLLAEAESGDPRKGKKDFAEELRQVVATVGKPGQPGEHVRCVVSVGMLTEGWDANNVTHILGIRAFGSQLLCEQVVGRGLRRMDYTPVKNEEGKELLTEEYVDVYGIPFSVIPFKGRAVTASATEDKPKQHVMALPERKAMEIRFPVVEGYAFALRKNLIKCDVASMESLVIEPHKEPTATFLTATVGYKEGHAASGSLILPLVEQDRRTYYEQNHIETIKFNLARIIVEYLSDASHQGSNRNARVFRLQSKHQLFPQVFSVVDEYIRTKVNFQNENPSELGLEVYVQRIIERLLARIEPDDESGEMPLMPILNRYKPIGSTAEVEFKTTRPCFATAMSHINQVVADTQQWEQTAAFRLEMAVKHGHALHYAKNDHLDLLIPYEYFGIEHNYIPDYLVKMANDVTLLLEIKGQEDNQDKAKHDSARRWISAVNNWGKLGTWDLHVCRNPQMLERELQYVLSKRLASK